MNKTTYKINKMDCGAEENMVRMKLEKLQNIKAMHFDIPQRKVDVIHEGPAPLITAAIQSLNLNSSIIKTEEIDDQMLLADEQSQERKLLWQVLGINIFFFALEVISGYIAHSMGLVADSLDMFADSIIYGLALFAVGGTIARKHKIARVMGYFQMCLAMLGFVEVFGRFFGEEEIPIYQIMIIISILALIGNATSLYLLQKTQNKEAHIKASTICTSSDVIVNIGVIIAAGLVYFTNSKIPDLIIGAIVFSIVARGAYRILKL
jgi:Co/Zn/Cd efflux system component